MAEAIVSTILEQLTAITIEKASEARRLVRGVEKEVKRLESNFKAIQYELEDAEEKQYLDKRLKHWLDRFRQVSYDMEDVLDDWKAAVLELQTADHGVETGSTSVPKWKVCPFASCFSFCSQVVGRHDIATRIKDINEELDQIVKDKDKFELIKRESIKQPKRPESTCFVDVSELYGRDGIKEEVIRTLLCGSSEEEERSRFPTIITILGMGGIGKTALAQLIFNDHRIQTHFDKKIWVCVSDSSDEKQIAQAILENLDSTIPLQNTDPLQTILSKIREKMEEKKFLLVLDDVWTDRRDVWEKLKPTFQSAMFGSRILVTTRKESVAKHMESSHAICLNLLSDEICWLILSQKAFIGRNQVDCENLKDTGRKIAEKCQGLPLAAKTLGGLLQDKLQREEWQNVLDNEIWKLDFAQDYLYAPLLLSYNDLPSTIRRCLLYCAIFPKDYKIDKAELIQHWMVQGYLNSEDKLRTELKGEYYFNYLATRSFFQDFEEDVRGDIICCKMHDIVHDFVQASTENEFVTKEMVTKEMVGDLTLDLPSNKPRHLRLVIDNRNSSPMSIYGTEKLRSLVVIVSFGFGKTIAKVFQNLCSRSKHLRLLEFDSFLLDSKEISGAIRNLIHLRYLSLISCCEIEILPEAVCGLRTLQSLNLLRCLRLKKLPAEIGKLINLRRLSLISCNGMEILPEEVCGLRNLQYLNLKGCLRLKKLPIGMGNLINLRYLCTVDCPHLTWYPKGIGNLTSLLRLNGMINVGVDCNAADEFSIGDLENLDLLGGILTVELTGDAIDWDEAKRAKLHNKIHLKGIIICLCSPHIKKEEVLQALNPPSNLAVEVTDYQQWLSVKETTAAMDEKVAELLLTNAELKAKLNRLHAQQGKNTTQP